MNIPVIASLGMGLHSSVMVDHWLADPTSRDFELSDLTVVSAQVGLEDQETGRQMEELLYPWLRRARVRTVQIARRGPRQADGLVVLDNTREPTRCFTGGSGYTLYDELISAGTVPQYANGQRRCSLKWKGWPIDTWLAHTLGGQPNPIGTRWASTPTSRTASPTTKSIPRGYASRSTRSRPGGWDMTPVRPGAWPPSAR